MTNSLGTVLLQLARSSIEQELGMPAQSYAGLMGTLPELALPGATFVTLTEHADLRGCMGTLQAHRSLHDDVCANARAAAFRDPRFVPMTRQVWPQIRVEVSLLTAPEPLPVADEADALRQLVPGRDGLIFSWAGHRSTFLPQVWEQLPQPAEFLARLKQKAGVSAQFWSPEVRLARYRVEKWKEWA